MTEKFRRISLEVYKNLKEKGPIFTLSKIKRNVYIQTKRQLTVNKRSLEVWKILKGKYEGKRAFLIGNGPSLNKTPIYFLANEYTMCFNRFNVMFERLSWKPTFYMNVDPLVAEDMAQEINEIIPNVDFAFFPDIHTHGLDYRTFIKDADNVQWMFPQLKGFYFDLPNVGLGGTVAYPALQVLTYLGFSEIYLIGVDMNYQVHTTVKEIKETNVTSTMDDDPNHFDPRYFGTNRKYHQPVKKIVDNMMNAFEFAANKIKNNTNTKVFNAGIGSMVKCFEMVEFNTLFKYTEKEAFDLFSKPFSNILEFESFDEMNAQIHTIAKEDEITVNTQFFLCDIEPAQNLIKKLVFDYVSFGPYHNKILFISRNFFLG